MPATTPTMNSGALPLVRDGRRGQTGTPGPPRPLMPPDAAVKPGAAVFVSGLGVLYPLGRYEEALVQLRQAAAIRERETNARATHTAHWMVARTLRVMGWDGSTRRCRTSFDWNVRPTSQASRTATSSRN